jgi:hypothetical protein
MVRIIVFVGLFVDHPKIQDMEKKYLPVVAGAAVVGDQVLRLLFSDGTVGGVDFSSERWTGCSSR